jgi:hypothetical protein
LVTTEGATPSWRAASEKLLDRAVARNAFMFSRVSKIIRDSRKLNVRFGAFCNSLE